MTDSSTHNISNEPPDNHSSTQDDYVLAELRALLFSHGQTQGKQEPIQDSFKNNNSPDPEEDVLALLRNLLFNPEQTQGKQEPVQESSKNNHFPSPEEDALAELRTLLFANEYKQFSKLQERLNDSKLYAADLSRVLPEAIILRSIEDQQLTKALVPTIEEAIKTSVRKDFKILANALFPVIGPAIRKAISTTMSAMLQSLNQTLNHSFSPQSVKWRLEARQTGKSFAEVVLLRTLLYRVEQVFLIHKKSGLLLQHVVAKAVTTQDGDLVSAMLTAIKDFVHDSFSVQKGESLETLQFGELTICIEEGPQAILASVIRGNAPQELRSFFQDALETIHLQQGSALESFKGDTAPFEACKPYLEDCLLVQFEVKEPKKHKNQKLIVGTVFGAILLALGPWSFFYVRDNQRWASYLEKLNAEPGIIVVAADKRHGKFFISGLRDPMAADPRALMKAATLSPQQVISRWEFYLSDNPKFIQARAKEFLQPPEGVSLKVDTNGILSATGAAPDDWVAETRRLAKLIPGITEFRDNNLIDIDLKEFESAKDQVEKQVVRFVWETQLAPGQNKTLQDLARQILKLNAYARSVHKDVRIQIIGHTNSDGSSEENMKLSQARAQKVSSILSQDIDPVNLIAVGMSSKQLLSSGLTAEDKKLNRRVTFKVIMSSAPNRTATDR